MSGSSRSLLSIASPTLVFISAAAAFVKVTTSNLSISTLFFSSVIIFIIRSTSTAVLPEPAAAETKRLQFLASITLCWSSVHLVSPISFLLRQFPMNNSHNIIIRQFFKHSVIIAIKPAVKSAHTPERTIHTG